MSCGIPCVVTDTGDSAQIVGDTGIAVPSGDPNALAGAWLRMIKMGRDKRVALGREARSRIEERFELGKIVNQFEAFYEKLM